MASVFDRIKPSTTQSSVFWRLSMTTKEDFSTSTSTRTLVFKRLSISTSKKDPFDICFWSSKDITRNQEFSNAVKSLENIASVDDAVSWRRVDHVGGRPFIRRMNMSIRISLSFFRRGARYIWQWPYFRRTPFCVERWWPIKWTVWPSFDVVTGALEDDGQSN